jgi:hypothetical protein
MLDSETRTKALDFQIDKTYAAILEVHRGGVRGLLTYLVLIAVTTALTFGEGLGVADKATIPLLQLSMNRHYAGIVTLFLSSAMLYWWFSYNVMEGILDAKLRQLLRVRYSKSIDKDFYYRHFTLLRMSPVIFRNWPIVDWLFTSGLLVFVLASTLVAPSVLAWYLARSARFGEGDSVVLIGAATVSVLPTLMVMFAGNDQRDAPPEKPPTTPWRRRIQKGLASVAFISYVCWIWFLSTRWSVRWEGLVPSITLAVTILLTIAILLPTAPTRNTRN